MTLNRSAVLRALAIVFTLAAPLCTLAATPSLAASSGIAGVWNGTLRAEGAALRLVLHVTQDSSGKLGVSLDSVDQNATGLAGENVVLKGNSFSFDIPSVHGKYEATLSADGNTLDGTWRQAQPLPLTFARTTPAAAPTPEPKNPARPPVALRDLKTVLDQELQPVLKDGLLSKRTSGGLVIGVLSHGERRIFAYGTAQPESIFEIGSITKTFTGLILAQMVEQKKVTLDEPVIELLPRDFGGPPRSPEITLLDLATQHSGLPRMPDNFAPENPSNPYADYDARQLAEFFAKQGLTKPAAATFLYSNLGFGLLGYALSLRAGVPYEQLLKTEITEPMRLHDTVITLSPAQRKRLIQGYDGSFAQARPWDFDVFAGAGAIRSTASDMLTYLDANMHPEKYTAGAAPGSAAATLTEAIALDHEARAEAGPDGKIALAWFIDSKTHSLNHNGGTGGYGSFAQFNADQDWAMVALYNRDGPFPRFVDRVGDNVSELLSGQPSVRVDQLADEDKKALAYPVFANSSIHGSYHCRLTAFPLPATAKDPFNGAASGDIHVLADGKGGFSQGTWEHRITAPTLNIHLRREELSPSS